MVERVGGLAHFRRLAFQVRWHIRHRQKPVFYWYCNDRHRFSLSYTCVIINLLQHKTSNGDLNWLHITHSCYFFYSIMIHIHMTTWHWFEVGWCSQRRCLLDHLFRNFFITSKKLDNGPPPDKGHSAKSTENILLVLILFFRSVGGA